jgi:hypothetical protein|tara:strand:- start:773 stop:943 length:171 start_codon:yes stop_codon:yes gene_type:complete
MPGDLKATMRKQIKPAIEKLTPAQLKGRRNMIKKVVGKGGPFRVASGAENNPGKLY